jgi:hypothetical protein
LRWKSANLVTHAQNVLAEKSKNQIRITNKSPHYDLYILLMGISLSCP